MNKRGVGVIFCSICALLFATRYIAAAIFMSGISSWNRDLFLAGLKYVGGELLIFSIVSGIIGIIYLIWGEFDKKKA